jgi:hypothetical protein
MALITTKALVSTLGLKLQSLTKFKLEYYFRKILEHELSLAMHIYLDIHLKTGMCSAILIGVI